MLHKHWNTIITLMAVFKLTVAFICSNQSVCLVKPKVDKTFNELIIEAGKRYSNTSFTILVYAGDYITTTETTKNFINFTNVTIKKHPDNNTMPVNIMCPEFTSTTHNGIGFQNCTDIEISGLNFMYCGPITSGLYFLYTNNIIINNSLFHHNSDNGIQIQHGNNITITNCHFYSNVGVQPDDLSDLISNDTFTRGAGLGLVFEYQSNVSVTINGCNFANNVAYKDAGYNPSVETRPFGAIPFGNGAGIYLSLYKVKNSYMTVSNCNFSNNLAIHQGGAIIMILLNSTSNVLNISGCTFIKNMVLGYFLRSIRYNITESSYSIKKFINATAIFDRENVNLDILKNLTYSKLSSSGGSGGAIAVSLFGYVERNVLLVSNSHFKDNVAFSAGAISFVVGDLLANVENGINSNQAFIHNCRFDHNIAFSGSAIAVASYARVDVASLPIEIYDCTFTQNDNLKNLLPPEFEHHSGFSGTVVGIRFPVSFKGANVFQSNFGGGMNMNHARVNVQGYMKFLNHSRGGFGGAVRLGELTLMHTLPSTTLEFVNNSALGFGGAIGIDNARGGYDTTLILNNMCFIQYNIGGEYEYESNNWNVNFIFINNTVINHNGQGQDIFADSIGLCIHNHTVFGTGQVFNSSIFSYATVFNFSRENKQYLETAPNALILDTYTVEVTPGEIFNLIIYAKDENENFKDAVYSYYNPKNLATTSSSIIFINLGPDTDSILGFASVNKATATSHTVQKISLVLHNEEQLKSDCIVNYRNSQLFNNSFSLNLIDSSDGQLINTAVVNSMIRCCHAAYEYNSITGECQFKYGEYHSDVILREERTNKKDIYIRSDRYGAFDSDNNFVTVPIPPSYQNCTQEGNLPGCIVSDTRPDEQCSQGRTGFVCGKCSQTGNSNSGTALNLIECVPCAPWHIGIFIIICFSIVVISFLIIYCNVGLPNALKGFLFFIQVVGYVYKTGVKDGILKWDFYLSRFFGFSLYFPLCISSNLDTVDVAMLGFITPLLMAICTFTYIVLARFVPHLSRRTTIDGIWFLVLIAYVYSADTCLNLLRCVQVYEPIEFKGKRVYYFDGELECFREKHFPYGVIAATIAVVVLLSVPAYVLAICFNLIKKGGPLRDVMSYEIEKECHWWSGYDLLRRLLFFIVYTLFENFHNDYTQFAITITAIFILMMTSRIHPYTKKWINFAEGLILLDLVFISVYYLDNNRLPSTTNNNLVIVLLILPFVYFILYLLTKLLWRKRHVETSDKQNVVLEGIDTFRKYWGSLLFVEDKEATTSFTSAEDSMYAKYRDELDDFVTMEN